MQSQNQEIKQQLVYVGISVEPSLSSCLALNNSWLRPSSNRSGPGESFPHRIPGRPWLTACPARTSLSWFCFSPRHSQPQGAVHSPLRYTQLPRDELSMVSGPLPSTPGQLADQSWPKGSTLQLTSQMGAHHYKSQFYQPIILGFKNSAMALYLHSIIFNCDSLITSICITQFLMSLSVTVLPRISSCITWFSVGNRMDLIICSQSLEIMVRCAN